MGRGGEELYLRLLQRLFPPDVGFQFLIGFPEIRQRRPQVLGQSVQAFPQCPKLVRPLPVHLPCQIQAGHLLRYAADLQYRLCGHPGINPGDQEGNQQDHSRQERKQAQKSMLELGRSDLFPHKQQDSVRMAKELRRYCRHTVPWNRFPCSGQTGRRFPIPPTPLSLRPPVGTFVSFHPESSFSVLYLLLFLPVMGLLPAPGASYDSLFLYRLPRI